MPRERVFVYGEDERALDDAAAHMASRRLVEAAYCFMPWYRINVLADGTRGGMRQDAQGRAQAGERAGGVPGGDLGVQALPPVPPRLRDDAASFPSCRVASAAASTWRSATSTCTSCCGGRTDPRASTTRRPFRATSCARGRWRGCRGTGGEGSRWRTWAGIAPTWRLSKEERPFHERGCHPQRGPRGPGGPLQPPSGGVPSPCVRPAPGEGRTCAPTGSRPCGRSTMRCWRPPTLELLLEERAGELCSWALVQHEGTEGSTGRPQTRLFPPVMAGVRGAARGGHAEGRCGEGRRSSPWMWPWERTRASQAQWCERSGMVAEFQRIVLDLEKGACGTGERRSSRGRRGRGRHSFARKTGQAGIGARGARQSGAPR